METQPLDNPSAKMTTIKGPNNIFLPKLTEENTNFILSKRDSQHDFNEPNSSNNVPILVIPNCPVRHNRIPILKNDISFDQVSSDVSPIQKKNDFFDISKNHIHKKKAFMMIQAFKKAKVFAGNIKRSIIQKNFKNITNLQKSILGDLSDFQQDIRRGVCQNVKKK